jgi:RND family efflux transporter MFP subunit
VAPKIAGRVERLAADMADRVTRGQVVAELDDDEYVQAVAQADADLAVAQANEAQARSALEIAKRELDRNETLREQGVASDTQLDAAVADHLAKQAGVKVAEAQVTRARAELATAKIRLGYTKVTASWSGEDEARVVAERFVDEGETVSANAPLMSIVSLDPITAVVSAAERDYGNLRDGQPVTLTTDAYPGATFDGRIVRISPVFRQASRQARVELSVANPDGRLKPGLFVRAAVVLDRVEDATIVPQSALLTREGATGVFVADEAGTTVRWQPIKVGIRDGERVQVLGDVSGRVVTLGQQLLDDGAPITIPQMASKSGAPPRPPQQPAGDASEAKQVEAGP